MVSVAESQTTYRIWFNVGAKASAAWVVQQVGGSLWTAPAVILYVGATSKVGAPGQTPKGWLECSGQLSRDGTTDALVIRP